MNTENKPYVCSPRILQAKFAVVASTPPCAWAAEQILHDVGIGGLSGWTWFFICFFSMLGWVVVDLDKAAGMTTLKEKLTLWKSIAMSNLAGFSMYVIGTYTPELVLGAMKLQTADKGPVKIPELLLFVFVAVGGGLGTRWWAKLENKLMGGD